MKFARIARAFFGQPHMLEEQAASVIGEYLLERIRDESIESNQFVGEAVVGSKSKKWKGYERQGSVGIIRLHGELVNRGAWMGANSGLVSYEGFSAQLVAAAHDPEVNSIVIDGDSPGGSAIGVVPTSRLIRKIADSKTITFVANGTTASAAYGLACGATEVVVGEDSLVGSIGCVFTHFDRSEQMKSRGVTVTQIHAGKRKIDLSPYTSMSDEARESTQALVDQYMDFFVGIVSENRSISEEAIRKLEAGVFPGRLAVEAGLADRVGTFDEVVDSLQNRAAGANSANNRRFSMSGNEPNASENTGITQEQMTAAVTQARSEGETAGAQAERERISAILGSEGIQGSAVRMNAALELAADAPSMSSEKVVSHAMKAGSNQADDPVNGEDTSLKSRGNLPDSLAQAGVNTSANTGAKAKIDQKAIYDRRRSV